MSQNIICHSRPPFLPRTQQTQPFTPLDLIRKPINPKAPLTRTTESAEAAEFTEQGTQAFRRDPCHRPPSPPHASSAFLCDLCAAAWVAGKALQKDKGPP